MSSTVRCLQALELLAQAPYSFSLSEIGSRLSIGKGTSHRIVTTLVSAGFAEQDLRTKRYSVAGRALWVGTAFLRHTPVYRISLPIMDDLARRTKFMTHLGIWDAGSVLYLHTVGPPRSLNLFSDTGDRRPVHSTGLGKALLAFRESEDELKHLFSQPLEKFTPHTITSLDGMREELVRIRECGYATDEQEGISGLGCVAAPIWDSSGSVVAAISVSSRFEEIFPDKVQTYAHMVLEAALRASAQLGNRPYTSNVAMLVRPAW